MATRKKKTEPKTIEDRAEAGIVDKWTATEGGPEQNVTSSDVQLEPDKTEIAAAESARQAGGGPHGSVIAAPKISPRNWSCPQCGDRSPDTATSCLSCGAERPADWKDQAPTLGPDWAPRNEQTDLVLTLEKIGRDETIRRLGGPLRTASSDTERHWLHVKAGSEELFLGLTPTGKVHRAQRAELAKFIEQAVQDLTDLDPSDLEDPQAQEKVV